MQSSKHHRNQEEIKNEPATSTKMTLKKESINSSKDVTGSTYFAVNAFRQWRKTQRTDECNVVLMNNAGTSSLSSHEQQNDINSINNLNQFPLVLSDVTMPEEDLSLKILALVKI